MLISEEEQSYFSHSTEIAEFNNFLTEKKSYTKLHYCQAGNCKHHILASQASRVTM